MAVAKTEEQKRYHREYMRRYYKTQDPEKREARLATMRAWYGRTREHRNLYERTRHHGLTVEKFNQLIKEQSARCALCNEVPVGDERCKSGFHIDHDHSCCPGDSSCGKCVRALLCGRCNRALGCFSDKPELLIQALAYLAKHEVNHAEAL